MTQREDREKERVGRETMGKFFYDLAKAIFTAMVVGSMVSFFTPDTQTWSVVVMLVVGLAFTAALATIGNSILNR